MKSGFPEYRLAYSCRVCFEVSKYVQLEILHGRKQFLFSFQFFPIFHILPYKFYYFKYYIKIYMPNHVTHVSFTITLIKFTKFFQMTAFLSYFQFQSFFTLNFSPSQQRQKGAIYLHASTKREKFTWNHAENEREFKKKMLCNF